MKKNITIENLNDDINKLYEFRTYESDPLKLFYIDRIIDSVKQFIYTSQLDVSVNQSLKSMVFDMATNVINYDTYYSYLDSLFMEFSKYDEGFSEIMEGISRKYKGYNIYALTLSPLVISRDDLIKYIANFYKSLDEELYGYFQSIVNNPFNTLCTFSDPSKSFSKDFSSGFSFNVNLINRSYISVYNPGNVDFYSSGVHEFGHSISFLLNPSVNMYDGFNPLVEVPSMFPEILSFENNVNGFNCDDLMLAKFRCLYSIYDIVNNMHSQSVVTNALISNNFKYNLSFSKALKNLNISHKFLKKLVQLNLDDNGIYALSYAIALELLYAYKEDKDTAIEEFKKLIMFNDPSQVFGYALDRIGFDKHLSEEIDSTIEGMRLVLKK